MHVMKDMILGYKYIRNFVYICIAFNHFDQELELIAFRW